MGDNLTTIVAIFLASVLMFVFPLMAISERTDDVSQMAVESAATEFVDDVRSTGKLSLEKYDKFVQQINSIGGNTYEINFEAYILDENPGVKTTQTETTKIGENVYYTLYTSQVEDRLKDSSRLTFKEGDIISVTVKNTNTTIGQTLRNFLFRVAGNDTYQIAAQSSGMVTVNGTK